MTKKIVISTAAVPQEFERRLAMAARLLAASASAWVASSRSSVAAHDGTSAAVGQSAAMSLRLKASVAGHIALDPNPSASRWYWVS